MSATRPAHRRQSTSALGLAAAALFAAAAAAIPSGLASSSSAQPDDHARRTLGVYPGYGDADALRTLEQTLGFDLDVVVQFGGMKNDTDLTGSIFGQLQGLSEWLAERDPLFSVTIPLAFGSADAATEEGRLQITESLAQTAAGAHDAAYQRVAEMLIGAGLSDAVVRIGHEFDGDWHPWSALATCEGYIAAYQHVATVLRNVSPEFRLEWTGTLREFTTLADCAYPGDEYVDIIGLDVYDRGGPMGLFSSATGTWNDPVEMWNTQFLPLLEYHHNFAVAHGKPVSYPEWGLVSISDGAHGGDNPTFIRSMAAWLRALPADGPGALLYHAYLLGVPEYDFRPLEQSSVAFFEEFGGVAS